MIWIAPARYVSGEKACAARKGKGMHVLMLSRRNYPLFRFFSGET